MTRTLPEEGEDTRPHWVKTLDRKLVHSSRPEDWNRSLTSSKATNPTAAARGKMEKQSAEKHKSHKNTGIDDKPRKRRGKSEGRGTQGGYVYGAAYPPMYYRSRSLDSSSVGSRRTTSSARREKKRSRMLALFCILLILAFIVAALIGWLTYFLLMRGRSDKDAFSTILTFPLHFLNYPHAMNQEHVGARNSSRTLAVDASLRILNETFTPGMVNTSSVDFLRIAGPVCEEVLLE
ncbi:hypothetical protein EGW08_003920 [Elysia chlorotica]|uniref:SEA domain-containing protein n=1 Tax=Elysia chlorotica TaxID=188477 RepID=A0A433U3F2_ELYCH|nr:hypothetical protein EGW08_003920 [Elysia chlorotica]